MAWCNSRLNSPGPPDAAFIFINSTVGGRIDFRTPPFRQTRPELRPHANTLRNFYAHKGWNSWNESVSISTGNFNNDGFVDFVRTGPKLPVTLFLNNIPGLQRARVTTSVEHRTGTTKTWNAIYGGTRVGAGTTINAEQGGVGVQAVQTE
jgi:hypothetical protein